MSSHSPSVAIVGAGAIGLACALELGRRGAAVRVFEAAPIHADRTGASPAEATARWYGAPGASRVAAGMLGAYSEALHDDDATHPQAMALRVAGLRAWRRFVATLSEDGAADAGFGGPFGGALTTAQSPARMEALLRLAGDVQTHGGRADVLDGAQVQSEEPALGPGVLGGVLFRDEGRIDPLGALTAMVDDAKALGVVFRAERVTGFERTRAGFRLIGPTDAERPFDALVIATGLGAAAAPLSARVPAMSVLRGATGCGLVLDRAPFRRTVRAEGVYCAIGGNGSAVLGGGMLKGATADEKAAADLVTTVANAAAALAPAVWPDRAAVVRATTSTRFGARPMTPDHAPMIGRDAESGALLAVGHGRNGWLLAPITAQIIAAHVFDDALPALWTAFSPNRFA